jgi:HSP20 family molecular chaperone IbpA
MLFTSPFSTTTSPLFNLLTSLSNELDVKTDYNVSENETNCVIEIELPRFEKEDVSVTVSPCKTYLDVVAKSEKLKEKSKRFKLNSKLLNLETISATLKNGVLTVEIERLKETELETRKIEIK